MLILYYSAYGHMERNRRFLIKLKSGLLCHFFRDQFRHSMPYSQRSGSLNSGTARALVFAGGDVGSASLAQIGEQVRVPDVVAKARRMGLAAKRRAAEATTTAQVAADASRRRRYR
jgi:hypothetical protein